MIVATFACALVLAGAPTSDATTSPIVLMPGFAGWGDMPLFGSYFAGIKRALEDDGFVVFEVGPPPIATNTERARFLLKFIDDVRHQTGAAKVHVIAHSQGGVDARVALTLPGGADTIATVTTLASPHRGSGVADRASRMSPTLVGLALGAWAIGAQWSQGLEITTPDAHGSIAALSVTGTTKRNSALARPPKDVPFFSVAGLVDDDVDGSCRGGAWSAPYARDKLHILFGVTRQMDLDALGRVSEDGVVPTASMRYGRFLGCAPADHVDWMGWGPDVTDVDGYVEFDHRAFLVELARGLRDVERAGDADAMNAHLPKLAKLAHAVYLGAPREYFGDAPLKTRY